MSRWQRLRTAIHLFSVGVRRHITLGARVAVFDGGRVLLVRHTYLPGWHFPGGGVEPGEAAADAARRELREEAGLEASSALTLFGLYHNVHEATDRDHLALFVCRGVRVIAAFRPNREIAETGWFSPAALSEGTEPAPRGESVKSSPAQRSTRAGSSVHQCGAIALPPSQSRPIRRLPTHRTVTQILRGDGLEK